jgi:hypothetical protein
MAYTKEDYDQKERDVKAQKALTKLKLELGMRETNEHSGSGLGGNASEYLFMLTHTVKVAGISEGSPSFSRVGSDDVIFYSPKKPNMRTVRQAFTKFLDVQFPDREIVTQEQLANPSFMRDLSSDKLEVKLFIRALEHTYELAKWLDLKLEMQRNLDELSSKECDALATLFLKEMSLPETYFQDHKDDKQDPMSRMLNRHPVWGARREAVGTRFGGMIKQLLSPEDNEKLQMIGAYPVHIALFALRSCVGIEKIVSLNLDELPSCSFLTELNCDIQSDDDDDITYYPIND